MPVYYVKTYYSARIEKMSYFTFVLLFRKYFFGLSGSTYRTTQRFVFENFNIVSFLFEFLLHFWNDFVENIASVWWRPGVGHVCSGDNVVLCVTMCGDTAQDSNSLTLSTRWGQPRPESSESSRDNQAFKMDESIK